MKRWPGIRAAWRVIEFLDVRSESVGESVSRLRLMEEGLPRPEPQREIFGPDGRFIACVDFYWQEHRTVGEFDGKIKYGKTSQARAANPGRDLPGETAGGRGT